MYGVCHPLCCLELNGLYISTTLSLFGKAPDLKVCCVFCGAEGVLHTGTMA